MWGKLRKKKRYVRQLSQADRDILILYKANDKLSIDQVAHFGKWDAQDLSTLVNSPEGISFLKGLDNLPPDGLDDFKLCANLIADLLPQYIKKK